MKPVAASKRGNVRELGKVVVISALLKIVLITALFASKSVFDTSSTLLFSREHTLGYSNDLNYSNGLDHGLNDPNSFWTKLASRLMAWDTVYFTAVASKGRPTFEQEYAFSPAWASLIRHLSPSRNLTALMLTAASISLVSHLLACMLIFQFTQWKRLKSTVDPYTAAIIYSASPGGIFLISGYTESSCAALTFLGLLLIYGKRQYILAGVAFGLATLLRSNGLFWGICFAIAVLKELAKGRGIRVHKTVQIIVGGSLLSLGFLYPQYSAYREFCMDVPSLSPIPQWCHNLIPSIYTHVQAKYWNNGFLKYWTVSNIPLFILALPSLILVALSTKFLWSRKMWAIAIVQLVVLIGLVFFWHVQIVNRISSGLPGPALYLSNLHKRSPYQAKLWVSVFLVWSITQASLYGAFLPPA